MKRQSGYFIVVLPGRALRWGACAVVVASAVYGALLCGRWALAETVLYVAARYPIPPEALVRARELQPQNPETPFRLGIYYLDVAQPPDFEAAERCLNESLALAPNRAAYWLTLGRLRDLSGREVEAESAYIRAAALAPAYWRPQWVLGNLRVRQGRVREAADNLYLASGRNPEMAPLAIRTVWTSTNGDVDLTARAGGPTVWGRSEFLNFLLSKQRTDDAFGFWRDLAAETEPVPNFDTESLQLASALLAEGHTDDAILVWTRLAPDQAPVLDRVWNGSFEETISEKSASPFAWTIGQSPDARVSLGAGRTGGKALRVDYNAKGNPSFSHAVQYVCVRPGASYTLSFWATTEDLQSAGLPEISVTGAGGKDAVSVAQALPSGSTDWGQYHLAFKGPASGIIIVRIARSSCGELCPIFGTIRIDDLTLEQK